MSKKIQRNKRIIAICCSLLITILTLSACVLRGKEKGSDDKMVINVVLKTQSSEFWGYVEVGCRAYAQEHPDTIVEIKGASSEAAVDEQRTIVRSDIESGRYHALVLAPLNSEKESELINVSEVPVIALDTVLTSEQVKGFSGMNNKEAARAGAKAAVEAAKSKGWEQITCVEIAGTEGESTSLRRREGFKKGITESGGVFYEDPLIYAHSDRDEATEAMENIMKAHPEGLAIVAAHNDDTAMAALEAASGNPAYENTVFIGFDGNGMACQAMKDDPKYANFMTVGQNPYEMGYRAVEAAVKAAKGEQIDGIQAGWTGNAPLIDTGWTVIDQGNVDKRLEKIQELWNYHFKPLKIYRGGEYE